MIYKNVGVCKNPKLVNHERENIRYVSQNFENYKKHKK